MDKESREKTAFHTPAGHDEWPRLPMVLRNAPLTFQRMTNTLFAGVIRNGLFVYLHVFIVVSKDLDSHLSKLCLVFRKLTQAGLKAKLTKCEFLTSCTEFLGYLVGGDGIHTVDSKISAVKNFPTPKSVENVHSFSGLAGYYRAFVKNFAFIASHLHAFSIKMYLFPAMMLNNKVSILSTMFLLMHQYLRFQIIHCLLLCARTLLP